MEPDSDQDEGQQVEGKSRSARPQGVSTTRGTGTTLAIGCVILFILLTIALAFIAQQFR